ncbi:ABC transporter substrate-binding protein [Aquipseudomonas alcaligenes]|uniref:Polar amino acid transport system substrate-binding protein n=1 Tax=Aquipseudomonas alcaligenes TaxID=43263 RepID=A0A1N6XRR2_AQUAC|nr:transporter substrate-binding domain-containing protein [Pseudomonas alcaligenes]SIR05018.1 polar amino acid transport system substrate-binding protein [Pseudomonas alcaligenes]
MRVQNMMGCRAILMAVLLLVSVGALADRPLNIYIGQGQMPFADDRADNRGLFGDLMAELCLRLQRECRYHSVPWKRVQVAVAHDPDGIVLNLGRTAEREQGFVWLLDVLPTSYVLASPQQAFDTLGEALAAGPVVVMGGTPRAQEAQALKQTGQKVVEVTDPEQAARMLHGGRVVAWYEIDLRVHYLWRRLGYVDEAIRFGRAVGAIHSFIAGSPLLHEAPRLQLDMQQAFAQMQADGSWRRILARHLGEELAARLSGS